MELELLPLERAPLSTLLCDMRCQSVLVVVEPKKYETTCLDLLRFLFQLSFFGLCSPAAFGGCTGVQKCVLLVCF